MRTLRPLAPLAVLLLLLLAGCATTGVNRGDVNLVSVEEEWALGQQLERDLAGRLDLVDDPTLTRYVSRMGQRIAAQTELGRRPWRFHVVRDPSINAFNVPGGLVYVHTGLLAEAESASELAGVLAHEIAHGVSRHGTERLTKAQGLNTLATLVLGNEVGAAEGVAAQIAAGGALAKFSRDDEREADRLGVRYMARAGYDPEGMATVFGRLLRERQRSPNAVAQFFSTHPLTEERLATVRAEARKVSRRGLARDDGEFAAVSRRARRYR